MTNRVDDLLSIYGELKKYKVEIDNKKSVKEREQAELKTKISNFVDNIYNYITNASLLKLIDVVVKNNPFGISFSDNTFTSTKTNIGLLPYNIDTLNNVALKARTGVESIKSISNLNDLNGLLVFCQSYNTLSNIVTNAMNMFDENNDKNVVSTERQVADFFASKGLSFNDENELIEEIESELFGEQADLQNSFDDVKLELGIGVNNKLSKENIKVAKELFGEERVNCIIKCPLELSLKEGNSSIFVDADVNDGRIPDFVINTYFNFLKNLDGNYCEIAGIECSRLSSLVLNEIDRKLNAYPYLKFTQSGVAFESNGRLIENSALSVDKLLMLLKKEKTNRNILFGRNYANIYEYNKKNENAKKNYILLIVNDFASTINTKVLRESLCDFLKDSYKYGIFAIIIGKNNSQKGNFMSDELLPIDLDRYKIKSAYLDEIDFSNINVFNDIDAILSDLDKNKQKSLLINTDEFLSNLDLRHPDYLDSLEIPIGLSEGNIFNLKLNSSQGPGGLILGKTRIGKTVFLHSLILSAAYKYTPDEVTFYLSDFKGTRSLTFAQYIKDEGVAYLPHVKFVSLTNAASEASDLVATIKEHYNSRVALFEKEETGSTLAPYNEKMRREGRPTMPIAIYIIDEYISMLNSNEDILDDFNALLTTVAHAGIKIFFSGHLQMFPTSNLGQFGTRVIFDLGESTKKTLNDLFNNYSYDHEGAYEKFLMDNKGCAFINDNTTCAPVRTSFPGTENSQRVAELAKKIREKYPDGSRQIVTGQDILIPFNEGYKLHNIAPFKQSSPLCLPLGFASSTYKPANLVFEPNDGGKIALGSSLDKQFLFEDTLLLSYLMYAGKDATYISFKNNTSVVNEYMQKHIENHKNLYKNVNVISSYNGLKPFDVIMKGALEVERIYQEYYFRKTEKNWTQPILLMIHQVSEFDLFDDYLKVRNNQKSKPVETSKQTQQVENPDFTYEIYSASTDNPTREEYEFLLSQLNGINICNDNSDMSVVKDDYDIDNLSKTKIREHITEMFADGSKCGIYVVLVDDISSANNRFLNDITKLDLDNAEKLVSKTTKLVMLNTVTGPKKDNFTIKLPNGIKILLYNTNEEYIKDVKEIE